MNKGELLNRALVLMVNAHANQFDKGGQPYALHPLAIMVLLNTEDEELQCIGLLHDVIEDTKVTYLELRDAGMSERVIAGVRAMTKQRGQTFDEYREGIFENRDAMLVKRADLTHNSDIRRLKGVSPKDIDRMVKYHKFFLEIGERLERE